MKIISIGNFGTSWDGSICDERHIADALDDLGHSVFYIQREDTLGDFNNLSPDIKPDWILISQWDGYPEDFIDKLKNKYHAPIVYWAFDYQDHGQVWHEQLISGSNLYLSKRIADSKYPNWQWFSQDFAPSFLRPFDGEVKQDIEVLFTGSYLPWATERNETLKVVANKHKLVIHSVNEWPKEWGLDVRPPIMDDGLPQLYARAKIILSIDHTIEAGYWSDRNAQIMACGRMPLMRYVPMADVRFGKYVSFFYSPVSCLALIEDWLSRPQEDVEMWNDTAYSYAINNLTVDSRVWDLLSILDNYED